MKAQKGKQTRGKVRQIQILSNDAREIVRTIASALGWKIHETAEGISAYSPSKALRIADHRTYMQTWVDNGSWNKPIKADVVIEDEPTKGATMVRIGYDFTIPEFVHPAESMTPEIAKNIAFDLKQSMENKPYANNARGQGIMLKSTHTNTTQQNTNNNKKLNCNRNMNKNRIRLTESQLHRVIKESVEKMLKESEEQSLGIRPNFKGGIDSFNEILSKAQELREMLQAVPLNDTGFSELAYVQGDLDDQLSYFITTLNKVITKTRGNALRY